MSPTEFMRAYEAVTNTHDLGALLELIADDAIYLFSNQTSHIGKTAIGKSIQANFEGIETRPIEFNISRGWQAPTT